MKNIIFCQILRFCQIKFFNKKSTSIIRFLGDTVISYLNRGFGEKNWPYLYNFSRFLRLKLEYVAEQWRGIIKQSQCFFLSFTIHLLKPQSSVLDGHINYPSFSSCFWVIYHYFDTVWTRILKEEKRVKNKNERRKERSW